MSNKKTYSIIWQRGSGALQICNKLTPRLAFARIIKAIKNSGSITVISIEKEK